MRSANNAPQAKPRLRSYADSDAMSLSSFKDGSLVSDLDDLTLIAEFDNYSEYEDVSAYRLSPTYEMVGYKIGKKNTQKTPQKTSKDAQTDDIAWKEVYNLNRPRVPTNNRTTQITPLDSNSLTLKNNNYKNLNNLTNTNNNNNNGNSRDSTLREVLNNNQDYDTDDFDGVVENNNRFPLDNNYSPPYDRKSQTPYTSETFNRNKKPIRNKQTKTTGTDPIAVDEMPHNNPSYQPPTSFYVPLEDPGGLYDENHPLFRRNKSNTMTITTKDKATNTLPMEEFMKSTVVPKISLSKSTMTAPSGKPIMKDFCMNTFLQVFNKTTNTEDYEANTDNVNDLTDQIDELIQENKDFYQQLEVEEEKRKRKERQYEEMMVDHENLIVERDDLRKKLSLLEQTNKNNPLKNDAKTQTESIGQKNVGIQENMINEIDFKNNLDFLQENISKLEDELNYKQKEAESLALKLEKEQAKMNDLMELNEQLTEDLKYLTDQLQNEKEIEKVEKAVTTTEALQTNQELQRVLKDTLKDLDYAQKQLNNEQQKQNDTEQEMNKLKSRLSTYEEKEGGLDKIISNLRAEINSLNEKVFEANQKAFDRQHLSSDQMDGEKVFTDEIQRLMQINTELNNALLEKNDYKVDKNLLNKYNNLRDLSSRLQTAVAPLKAKLSLANRKINEKNSLLEALLKNNVENDYKVPKTLRKLVQESIQEQPRPLSPLTIDHVDRLEHDLSSHLNQTLPESLKSKRTKSYSDLFDTQYSSPFIDESRKSNSKLLSLFDEPDIFDKKPVKDYKTSKLRASSCYSDRQPVLIDTASSIKVPTDSHLLLTKSLQTDVLGNKKPFYDTSSVLTSKKPPSTINGFLYDEISPPRNFQIEKMEGRKKLLFCWEPPLEQPSNSPVVGYELYVGSNKHTSIKGKSKNNLEVPLPDSLPCTFALHSLSADGNVSEPSQIILHGINRSQSGSLISRKKGDKLKSTTLPLEFSDQFKELPDKTFVAFFDFESNGKMQANGYSELTFHTGDIIETFGDPIPNGYILGKLKGSKEKGLVPSIFLHNGPTNNNDILKLSTK